ncbi:ABC transporter permease subunit [Actinomadura sp. 3N407]|uniref:ABC transporter permease subunit n=1 Tax=Actinomadura sp. 3N407 TaxID=3457423 RepID=UPI003FCE455B
MPEAMRGFGFDDMTSAAGYLQGPVFGLLVPLLATFYGAATGARMISADEESGYLDLLLAHPIGRARLLLHRFTALATGALLIAAMVLGAMLPSAPARNWTRSPWPASPPRPPTWRCSHWCSERWPLVSAWPPAKAGHRVRHHRRGGRAGLRGQWLRPSDRGRLAAPPHPVPHYIGGAPLKSGLQFADAAVLAVVTVLLIGLGSWRFVDRDLSR